jgi:nicotinamidase-related amidase
MRAAMHADAATTAIDARVAPQDEDIVVRKTRVGPFSTTDLHEQLQSRGVDTLVLAGISTAGVVLSTVRQAADFDYRVVVVSDACADPDPEVHAILMEKVFPRQADVVSVKDAIDLLG